MSTNIPRRRSLSLAPLVLRLAVAGIFGAAAFNQLGGRSQPLETDAPALTDAAPAPLELEERAQNLAERVEEGVSSVTALGENTPAKTDESGVQVNLGWNDVVGIGELGFAAILLLGLFTRLAALLGVSMAAMATLADHQVVGSGAWVDHLVGLYQSNPLAMLLLGAICLSLVVSGSGPLALDRVFFGRLRSEQSSESASTA